MKIAGRYDVTIAGGGTSGIVAALATARTGAKTCIVEQYGFLGGTMTASEVHQIMTFHASDSKQIVKGIPKELIDKLKNLGGSLGHVGEQQGYLQTCTPFDPEMVKYLAVAMTEEERIDVLLHSYIVDALTEGNRTRGIIIENKSGRQAVMSDVVVDCTGDADVAVMTGAPYQKEEKSKLQPTSLIFRMGNVNIKKMLRFMKENPHQFKFASDVDLENFEKIPYSMNCLAHFDAWKEAIRQGKIPSGIVIEQAWFATSGADIQRREINVNITRVADVDGTNGWDLSRAEIEARKQVIPIVEFLKQYFPGFESSYLVNTAPQIGVRDTRRIIGEYMLTKEDILRGKTFEDTIGKSACPIDVHESTAEGKFTWIKTNKRGSIAYDIPYRCLIPKGIDNILVAGRCISATHEALGSTRLMATCMVTGQAAGTAAALASRRRISLRTLEVKSLQEELKRGGVILWKISQGF